MMRWALVGMTLLAVAAATPSERRAAEEAKAQAALSKELAGLVPGKPQTCINQFITRDYSATSFGDTLVYRRSVDDTRYVTHTTGCTGIGNNGDNILITNTPSTELCRGDIATTVDRVSRFQTGSCSFGDFVPYHRP